jgi:hypothetical protein
VRVTRERGERDRTAPDPRGSDASTETMSASRPSSRWSRSYRSPSRGSPPRAEVHKVSFTSSVAANDGAMLSVLVSRHARCTITVVYDTTVSHARGLGAKTGTRLTWRWKVGSSTHPGRWPVTVNCRKSGTLKLHLRVR